MKYKILALPSEASEFIEARKSEWNVLYIPPNDPAVSRLDPNDFVSYNIVRRFGIKITADTVEDAEWAVFTSPRDREEFIRDHTDGKRP